MTRSLRRRIQIWNALIVAIAVTAFGVAIFIQAVRTNRHSVDGEIESAVAVLVGKLQAASPRTLREYLNPNADTLIGAIKENGVGGEQQSTNAQFDYDRDKGLWSNNINKLHRDLSMPQTFHPRRMRNQTEKPYFIIWRSDGSIAKCSKDCPDIPCPQDKRRSINKKKRRGPGPADPNIIFRSRGELREAYADGSPYAKVLVGRNISKDNARDWKFGLTVSGVGLGIWFFGLLGGAWLARKSTEPIDSITKVAAEISSKNLDERIDTSEMDVEFQSLSNTLNGMIARLDSAFRQQSQFTADASHELRTPLSVIQVHQDLALSKPRTPEEYQKSIEICRRSVDRMGSLIESLLVLARLDSGKAMKKLEPVNIKELVENEVEKLEPIFAKRGITIEYEVEPATIDGDRWRLGRVLSNLLTNAFRHSPDGSKINITSQLNSESVVVCVADEGSGIHPDQFEKIFDRFYRVDEERSRESGGSGLGLSICKSIIESHGGSISVSSEPEAGAMFQFSLPVNRELENRGNDPAGSS